MACSNGPIVPTLINIATFPDIAAQAQEKFPRYAAHMLGLWERRAERILEAYEAGVAIYAGTDAGSVIQHGRIADEIQALHAAGLPAAAALDAAAWAALADANLLEDDSGVIADAGVRYGAAADEGGERRGRVGVGRREIEARQF